MTETIGQTIDRLFQLLSDTDKASAEAIATRALRKELQRRSILTHVPNLSAPRLVA